MYTMKQTCGLHFKITYDSEDEARAFIRKYIDGKEVLAMDMARSAY